MELRLIRVSVKKNIEDLLKRKKIFGPESDDAVEITNDLVIYRLCGLRAVIHNKAIKNRPQKARPRTPLRKMALDQKVLLIGSEKK
jgi:hypothetical protein